jgi:hypothetical protein
MGACAAFVLGRPMSEEMRLSMWLGSGRSGLERRWSLAAGAMVLLLVTGCRDGSAGRRQMHEMLARVRHSGKARRTPDEMAAAGTAAIVNECAKESFANARTGLIVGETRLHEDVFELRDPDSFAAIAYGMDETLRLEGSLRTEAKAMGSSAASAGCVESFAAHLQTLTDPLLEGDSIQKDLDVSAFDEATREAEEQREREPTGTRDARDKVSQ